jgi:hypothetical protein
MILVLVTGLLGGLMTASTVSADPTDGQVVEIPRIDVDDVFGTGDWDTKIQVQNPDPYNMAYAVAIFWKAWSKLCPSNDPGPFYHACMPIQPNGVWTLHNQIPDLAESAIIYSFATEDDYDTYCTHSNWDYDDWFAAADGPDLAVTVDRWGPDPYGEFEISSSYTGIADPGMVGSSSKYFAPYVMHNYHDLDTTITIQNSGDLCTSCWIHYKQQGNCEQMKAQHIENVAPGEAIRIGPGADADMNFPTPEVGSDWLGSAYISCTQPMAIIVDQLSNEVAVSDNVGTLLTMRGMPYKPEEYDPEFPETAWDKKWYADLLYRELSGWDSSIQVQNMTQSSLPTFVTVEFFDQSGDHIFYLGEWVCRNGTATFYLPAIIDLGVNYSFGYVGAAEIESHYQIDYPGGGHEGEPIVAVVDIKKRKVWDEEQNEWRHTFPGETQGGAYNAHPEGQKTNAWGWAMPYLAKEQAGVTSRIVIRNNSNCTKITGDVYIKDETGGGPIAVIPVNWLQPKHMKVIDLNYFGQVYPGYVGAGEFFVDGVEQLCDLDGDGHTDIEPVMPSVVVLNYGWEKELPSGGGAGPVTDEGDLTRVYEAIPFGYQHSPCVVTVSGHVIDEVTLEPVYGEGDDAAVVSVNGVSDETDSSGYYEIRYVRDPRWTASEDVTLQVVKSGYYEWAEDYTIVCDDIVVNPELVPECETIFVYGWVEDKETGLAIAGADVYAENYMGFDAATTDEYGSYNLELPYDPDGATIVSAWAEGYNGATDSVYIPACGDWADITFQLHQMPDSRILLYWGNGGAEPDVDATYDELAAMYDAYYIVEYTDTWPSDPDLSSYHMVVLLLPGLQSDLFPDNGFTEAQAAQMGLLIADGGRVVLITDDDAAFSPNDFEVQNDLLDRLGIGIDIEDIFTSTITYDEAILEDAYDNEFTPQHVEGDGFAELTLDDEAFQLYVNRYGTIVVAGDKVGDPNVPDPACETTGHDVIVISDDALLEDAKLAGGWPDNETLALELLWFPTGGTCP